MDLRKENESLKRQLEQLAEARNREILDLQHNFANQLRELEKTKGLDRTEEIAGLNQRIRQLESELANEKKDNASLKNTVSQLEGKLKSAECQIKCLSDSLETARMEAQKTRPAQPPPIDFEAMLAPFEEQLENLRLCLTQKQTEIKRLQGVVHQECAERLRLQNLLGTVPRSV
jgi:small-conductance mechanosensitive channel